MTPGLHIVGTPIGNLEDLSARALETLRRADCILAEDTRHTRILLDRHQIRGTLVSCHRFNEAARAAGVVERLRAGQAVALVTNAGMPGVCDPGARIVAACRAAGLPVTVVPGPSAVTAAVALSGFVSGSFRCEGFLPRKAGARRRRLEALRGEPAPVVLFESPYRCLRLLAELREVMPERGLFLGRELTKRNEECLWGTAGELHDRLAARGGAPGARAVRGELALVLAPAERSARGEPDDGDAVADADA